MDQKMNSIAMKQPTNLVEEESKLGPFEVEKPVRILRVNIKPELKDKKPFPKLNSLLVTSIILAYTEGKYTVLTLLQTLSHTSRSYFTQQEANLNGCLVANVGNYTNFSVTTKEWHRHLAQLRLCGEIHSGEKNMQFGCVYSGELDSEEKPCGEGIQKHAFWTYTGQFKNGKKHGFGVCKWVSGN